VVLFSVTIITQLTGGRHGRGRTGGGGQHEPEGGTGGEGPGEGDQHGLRGGGTGEKGPGGEGPGGGKLDECIMHQVHTSTM
jgi:hypothetical protein